MRLLTHNMLRCPRTKAYPLKLIASTCDDVEVPYSEPFIKRMLTRLEWDVFRDAANQFPDEKMLANLPLTSPEADSLDDSALKAIHRALLEWHVVDGILKAETGSEYTVKNGIPNLVITEVRVKSETQDEEPQASGSSKMEVEKEEQ